MDLLPRIKLICVAEIHRDHLIYRLQSPDDVHTIFAGHHWRTALIKFDQLVGQYPHDQIVTALFAPFDQTQVTGMKEVKNPGT